MASLREPMLLEGVNWAGSSRSAVGDSDPRLIEQPHSAIATNAIGAEARGPRREAPENELQTGLAIAAEYSRTCGVLIAGQAAECISAYSAACTPRLKKTTRAQGPRHWIHLQQEWISAVRANRRQGRHGLRRDHR